MPDVLTYILCGLGSGIIAGYLGLGGGIVIVPMLTLLGGVSFRSAIPAASVAIIVNSFTSSNEYLKKGMVEIELVAVLAIFMVLGNISGSFLNDIISVNYTKLVFTALLIYTAFSFLKSKSNNASADEHESQNRNYYLASVIAFGTGIIAGLLGVGGGVVLIPMMYLLLGLPLTSARGTSSLMVGFAAAASTAVYFMKDRIDFDLIAPLIVGIIVGGKIGGLLGTKAKPTTVKIIFGLLMLYTAIVMGNEPIRSLF